MRILIVIENFPWPSMGGGLIRLARTVEALADIGDVDLFVLVDPRLSGLELPSNVRVRRLRTAHYPDVSSSLRWRAQWIAHRGVPLDVVKYSGDTGLRREFEAWAEDHYDVAWFSTGAAFEWLGRPKLGPTIVDLVDLEDEKVSLRVHTMTVERPAGRGLLRKVRHRVALGQARLNVGDWQHWQRSIAGQVERVVLSSNLDVGRSGLANAVAVPNSYDRPASPAGRIEVGTPPVVLLQGSLTYPPNMDAARWLADEIGPLLRVRIPNAEIRLVGTPGTGVELLHRPPEVIVVGRVPTMDSELALADVVIVPIRYGSGTRVKILESFAHRIPVVSTTIGAEGLDVRHGTHLLLADDPEALADACCLVLVDADLRSRLVARAEQQYLEYYDGSMACDRIRRLVLEVADSTTRR
jgi:glycosyltransferase involved in cell wall biosynthesis